MLPAALNTPVNENWIHINPKENANILKKIDQI